MPLNPDFDRRSGIGASEAAAILGMNPWESAFQLWLRKTGQAPEKVETPSMKMGTLLEPVVVGMYSERCGFPIADAETRRHPDFPMVFATPDRIVPSENRGVECKVHLSPRAWSEYGDDGGDTYPARYGVQTAIQAATFDFQDVDLAALLGVDLRVYRIRRDRETERRILELLAAWWDRHVTRGIEPPMDATAQEWLARKYATPKIGMLFLNETNRDAWASMLALRDAEKVVDAATNAYESAVTRMKAMIADAEGVEADGLGRVTWRKAKDAPRTDWKAVAAALAPTPELIAANTTTTAGSRRFLVKWTDAE